jgi:hypothetical protein
MAVVTYHTNRRTRNVYPIRTIGDFSPSRPRPSFEEIANARLQAQINKRVEAIAQDFSEDKQAQHRIAEVAKFHALLTPDDPREIQIIETMRQKQKEFERMLEE